MNIAKTLKFALKSMLSFQMGEVATDKAVLVFEGDELAEGMDVYILNESGEAEPAADGDYTTEDGKVIKVVEGRVAEIVDPKAEVAEEQEEIAQEEVSQEEEVPAPADEPEVEEEEKDVDSRIADLEERIAAFTDGINQIVNSLAALEGRIAEVEGKLAKVEAPQADPVDEEPEVEQTNKNSKLSYLRRK